VILTAAVYSNTLRNSYHLDSSFRIADNAALERVWPPSRFFTDIHTGSSIPQLAEYRPLMPLSHSLDVAVSKALGVDRLVIFHLSNLFVHLASVLLLYLVFCDLLRRWSRLELGENWIRNIAFGASLIFAIHPVSGVTVNYLANRDLLLMVLFQTAALGVYIRMRRGGDSVSGWCATIALLTLALFSKLNAVVFFALVWFFEVLLARTRWSDWRLWARAGSFFLLAGAFLFLNNALLFEPPIEVSARSGVQVTASRSAVVLAAGLPITTSLEVSAGTALASTALQSDPRIEEKPAVKEHPLGSRLVRLGPYLLPDRDVYIMTMGKVHLFHYARNFVWPFRMRPLPKIEMVESLTDGKALLGGSFILATLVLAWTLRRRSPVAAFSILAYWVLFSVTSSIFPLQEVVRDYRQYPSLPFLCLTLGTALSFARSRPARWRAAAIITLAATIYFASSTYVGNTWWRTEESLWRRSTALGGDAMAHVNLALTLAASDPDLAERHYLHALREQPTNIYALINLGLLTIEQGRPESGLLLLRQAVAAGPEWALAHYYLAVGLWRLGRPEEALGPVQRAAQLNRYRIDYQYRAAQALQLAGKTEESLPYLAQVTDLNPDYLDAQFLLGWARQQHGDLVGAVAAYRRFLRGQPNHLETRLNLGISLRQQGACDEAVEHFEHVLALEPNQAAARRHLNDCRRELAENEKVADR
jgi:tetratricopeptide (TPR) repeat protein